MFVNAAVPSRREVSIPRTRKRAWARLPTHLFHDDIMAENEKAKLYQEIVQQTDSQALLERMRLHGFWPDREGVPLDPSDEAAERARIEAEIAQLRKTQSLVKNPEKALAEERKRRWQESKKRRAEAKAKRAAEKAKRLQEWEAEREASLVHAG